MCVCTCITCIMHYEQPNNVLSSSQDIVDTHPGLEFLRAAPEFHSRYIETVSTASITYTVYRHYAQR